jgi:hypothetical protein
MMLTLMATHNVRNKSIIFEGFYFRVCNTQKDETVKFNIINMSKNDSLYNYGMKVLVFSEQDRKTDGVEWIRGGDQINYSQNIFKRVRMIYELLRI